MRRGLRGERVKGWEVCKVPFVQCPVERPVEHDVYDGSSSHTGGHVAGVELGLGQEWVGVLSGREKI